MVFGDHKPWLGNDASVYQELGVSFELGTVEGFYNYYSTPYLIWANSAAKEVLGREFIGDGGDMSPCFLMTELFDCCGWEGPAFMRLARATRAYTPLAHVQGLFLMDGAVVEKTALPENILEHYLRYRRVEYWRERNGLKQ